MTGLSVDIGDRSYNCSSNKYLNVQRVSKNSECKTVRTKVDSKESAQNLRHDFDTRDRNSLQLPAQEVLSVGESRAYSVDSLELRFGG